MKENKEMKSVVDAKRKEIEMLLTAQRELLQQLTIRNMELEDASKRLAARDKEAAEQHQRFHCCEEELTRCRSELDALRARMALMEEDNVKSLGEAEAENKALQDLHAKMRLETTAALQDLHEKLQLKQQKDQVGMMGKLMEEVKKTSLLAAQDLKQSKETIIMKENCARALMEENKELKSVVDAKPNEIEMLLAAQRELLQQLTIRNMELEDAMYHASKRLAARDKEAAEQHQRFHCCEEELTRCRSELDALQRRRYALPSKSSLNVKSLGEAKLDAELDASRETVGLMEEHNNCFLIKSLAGAGTRLAESDEEKLKTQCINDSNALRERMGLTVAVPDALRKEMDALIQHNCFLTKERDDARKAHEELASQIDFLTQEL